MVVQLACKAAAGCDKFRPLMTWTSVVQRKRLNCVAIAGVGGCGPDPRGAWVAQGLRWARVGGCDCRTHRALLIGSSRTAAGGHSGDAISIQLLLIKKRHWLSLINGPSAAPRRCCTLIHFLKSSSKTRAPACTAPVARAAGRATASPAPPALARRRAAASRAKRALAASGGQSSQRARAASNASAAAPVPPSFARHRPTSVRCHGMAVPAGNGAIGYQSLESLQLTQHSVCNHGNPYQPRAPPPSACPILSSQGIEPTSTDLSLIILYSHLHILCTLRYTRTGSLRH